MLSKVALAFASHGVQEELVTEALKALFRRAPGRGGGGFSGFSGFGGFGFKGAPCSPLNLWFFLYGCNRAFATRYSLAARALNPADGSFASAGELRRRTGGVK